MTREELLAALLAKAAEMDKETISETPGAFAYQIEQDLWPIIRRALPTPRKSYVITVLATFDDDANGREMAEDIRRYVQNAFGGLNVIATLAELPA